MGIFQPIICVPVEIVRHHKVFYEFYVCPHAPNKIEGGGGGEKRSSKKKSRFTFFCYLVNIESIYIVLQLKLEKHWNR